MLMPKPISKIPEIMRIAFMCRLNHPKTGRARSKNSPTKRKGKPRPIEYAASKIDACTTFASRAAYKRIEDRIGPIHGDQPAAKAMPSRSAFNGPAAVFCPGCIRTSVRKKGIKSKNVLIPRRMTNEPAIRLIIRCAELPINFMPPPKIMARSTKIIVKPLIKKMVRTSSGKRRTVPERRSAALSPDINEIYTGISGSTQGLKKESNPAIKEPKKPVVIERPSTVIVKS